VTAARRFLTLNSFQQGWEQNAFVRESPTDADGDGIDDREDTLLFRSNERLLGAEAGKRSLSDHELIIPSGHRASR